MGLWGPPLSSVWPQRWGSGGLRWVIIGCARFCHCLSRVVWSRAASSDSACLIPPRDSDGALGAAAMQCPAAAMELWGLLLGYHQLCALS